MMTRNTRRNASRAGIKPLGVGERLGTAPPSRYTHTPAAPPETYVQHGVTHRTDGTCHETCEDWR